LLFIRVVKLREHPLLLKNWPPVWTQTKKEGGNKLVRGEVGVLNYVHSNPKVSGKCYLVMDYEGESYVGTMTFVSHAFCKQFGDLLNRNLKRPIKDIGDLDLSHPL